MQHEHDAQRIIDSSIDLEKQKIIIIYKEDWHFGVVGIVASRVKDKYNFPGSMTFVQNKNYQGLHRSYKKIKNSLELDDEQFA